jgi:serine/threonine protein kinase
LLAYLLLLLLHRAARNVLVNSERRGKVSDFGMSRESADDSYYISRGGALPVRWTAPEALEHRKFSAASDVWAFGVLLYELWTRAAMPYSGFNNQKVWIEVQNGYRLPRPDTCPQEIYDRMLAWLGSCA